MRFIVVTGISGAGRTTALKYLEDDGYYCVDNLPVRLLERFMELVTSPGSEISRAALGLDVRADMPFSSVVSVLTELRNKGYRFEILFLDCSDEVLVRRFKESRRAHPLSPGGRIIEGIRKERELLSEIREMADRVIDTTDLTPRQFGMELKRIFAEEQKFEQLAVTVMSFGFKYGVPEDADLLFDVRFLPNPFYIEALKRKTGQDAAVRDYVLGFPQTEAFLRKLSDLISFLIPYYIEEGKSQLMICIGCTGGQHRSVVIADALAGKLAGEKKIALRVVHREAGRYQI